MSSLRGMVRHQQIELFEQVTGVVRSWAGLGMVLHAERGRAEHAQTFAHAVVEVDVGHLGDAGERVGCDREVVVLARDLDLIGGETAYWVVATVMTERQLLGRRADG